MSFIVTLILEMAVCCRIYQAMVLEVFGNLGEEKNFSAHFRVIFELVLGRMLIRRWALIITFTVYLFVCLCVFVFVCM